MNGAVRDLVVYFASSRYDGPPGHDRHMARALSAHRPVLFVEPPLSALTRLRSPELASLAGQPPLQVVDENFARLIPWVLPGMTRPGIHHLVPAMMRRAARRAVRRLYGAAGPVAAVVSGRLEPVFGALPAARRLYYSTDDLVAGADLIGLPRKRLVRQEAVALRTADRIAAVSPPLRERYAAAGFDAALLPNGCDPDAYAAVDAAPLPSDVDLSGPVAGLVGHINDRIDLALLEAVAAAGHPLLIVGPVAPGYQPSRFMALTGRPNVRWVGPKPLADLPGYLRVIDVGLTPYADTAFNRGSFPLKTLEYLAAGRAVVATPLPSTRWLGTDLVTLAGDPSSFASAVGAALASTRTPELVTRRQEFARSHSWDERARALAALLGLVEREPAHD